MRFLANSTTVTYFLGALATLLTPSRAAAKDNGYVYTGFVVPEYTLAIDSIPPADDLEAEAESVTYTAVTTPALMLGIDYKGLTVGTSFDMTPSEKADDGTEIKKMESSYTSYDLSYYFDRVGFNAAYIELSGMQLNTVSNVPDTQIEADPDKDRPDIRLRSQLANLWIMPFAYNLSLSTYSDPAAKSKGSGIGLVLVGSYNDLRLTATKSLVMTQYATPYGEDAGFTDGNFVTLSSQLGPAFTLDVLGLYVSGLVTGGSGNQKATYTVNGVEKTVTKPSFKIDAYFAVGYKGPTYFATLNLAMDEPGYRLSTVEVRTAQGYVALTLGRRY